MAPLKSGVTYQASKLPLPVRVTPPIAGWRGTQWKANGFSPVEIEKRHLTCSSSPKVCAPPYFGWAVIGQAGTAATKGVPRGIVLVMAGYSRTPSVAATVRNLRTRGSGATYEQTSAVGDCSGDAVYGGTYKCTITNDDIQPVLHVIKHVIGATVLGWFIAGEAAHFLLDIGFLWTIYIDGEMNLLHAHEVSDAVEAELGRAFPHAEIIIHEDPAGIEEAVSFPARTPAR